MPALVQRGKQDMRLFVGNHILQALTVHPAGQIDLWLENTQYKRGIHILALKNVASEAHGSDHFSPPGIRLSLLSKESGQVSRMATNPQRRIQIHLGAFFKPILSSTTASTSNESINE